MKTYSSREVIKTIKADGWFENRYLHFTDKPIIPVIYFMLY